ncbi:hypothetical protein ORI89_17540 [Sphingobacterium sp. UT-1RO-CII-1]|uniref:hypothetical protein n=1 Tax=Sphingobacterium sp. UT-1RO-CII-1 TaxID=2995225 RepID=UPI00227A4BAD|nr:hypothetical protein [Sphingobacterium sp. UT-1RO-CII-1]MCY4781464.1 hypothetical protein [Sphingobacterium sp. UT-1RO-CII-1]
MKRFIRKHVRRVNAWWIYLSPEAQDGARFLGQMFILAVAFSFLLKILILIMLNNS